MLPEIEKIDKELSLLEMRYSEVIASSQAKCSHPIEALRECKYEKCDYLSDMPPCRVCTICGLLAEGWSHLEGNYPKMQPYKDVPIISRGELFRYVRRT